MKSLKLFLYALMLWFSIGTAAAQTVYPSTEQFNPGTTWTFNNGSGVQNYGPPENFATTNVGTTPYPNGANITITSPTMNLTNCLGVLTVSFPLTGIIENGWDFLRFQYQIGAGPWITVQSFTGNQNATFSYTSPTIPNTATQFRFLLQTDNTVNTYTTGPWWNPTTNVYYYDIAYFRITCSAVLPIELVSFKGVFNQKSNNNDLTWITESERDNDYFTIERRANDLDGTWVNIATINGAGNSIVTSNYLFQDNEYTSNVINYYRISQTDYDGKKEVFDDMIIAIDNRDKYKKIIKIVNILGQEIKSDTPGVVIYIYEDNTIKRFVNM